MTTPEPRTRARHPSKSEREARITEIYKLLVMRVARHDILQFCANKTDWELKERAVDYLIAAATKRFHTEAKYRREIELGRSIATTADILSRTLRVQDYKTALAAQKELNELLGLYAPKRVALTDPDGTTPSYVALLPEPIKDHAAWSERCKQERAELDRQQASASSPASTKR